MTSSALATRFPADLAEPGSVGTTTSRGVAPGIVASPLLMKMLDLLPAARRVLEIGAAGPAFAQAYEQRHGVTSFLRPGDEPIALGASAETCDLVVLPDGLRALADPLATLGLLAARCPAGVALFIAFPSPDALGTVLTPEGEPVPPIDHGQQARYGARAPLGKVLMDAGWMPHLVDYTFIQGSESRVDGLVVEGTRTFDGAGITSGESVPCASFAVVVPTNRTAELDLNVACSPGLTESKAPIYAVRDATSPGDALATALPHVAQDWVLLCHQDVYFPAGFGQRLDALLAAIPVEEHARTLIGFVGMAVDAEKSGYVRAGFMIDRLYRLDHPDSHRAVSMDECAVVLSRHSLHRIDPTLGWHLWATDLCLTAIFRHEIFARIVRLPLFHNSANDSTLTEAFHTSSARLLEKFPEFGPIPTLCGTIQPAAMVAAAGAAEDGAPVLPPPTPAAGCCICGTAVAHWLPHPNLAARSEFMKLLDAVGSDLSVYQCPHCHSTDRDRHLWHYMNALGLLNRVASMRVLHIAPERHLEALLQRLRPSSYVRGDLHPLHPEHRRLDVEALEFEAGSFDLIICNHVLEHVASPARALAEFHRCLGVGGLLIAQTPYAPSLKNTFEMHQPVSTGFARLFYGQQDHVRLFGADIVDRFREAGFQGDLLPHPVVLPGLDALAHGCNPREPFFCFSK